MFTTARFEENGYLNKAVFLAGLLEAWVATYGDGSVFVRPQRVAEYEDALDEAVERGFQAPAYAQQGAAILEDLARQVYELAGEEYPE